MASDRSRAQIYSMSRSCASEPVCSNHSISHGDVCESRLPLHHEHSCNILKPGDEDLTGKCIEMILALAVSAFDGILYTGSFIKGKQPFDKLK